MKWQKLLALAGVGAAGVHPCCGLESSSKLLKCANESIAGQGPKIHLFSLATPDLCEEYATFTLAINSAYATSFGHRFSHFDGVGLQGKALWRAGNVAAIREVLKTSDAHWLCYLDADAAVVDFSQDALQAAVDAAGDEVHLMISRGEVIGPGASSLFNSGFLLLRQHRWSRDFVERWWQLQSVGQRNDQEILEGLYSNDVLDAKQHLKILPLGLFYSEIGNPISNIPAQQHVVHLAGVPNEVRRQVFSTFWKDLCSGSESHNASSNPQSLALRDVYLQSMAEFLTAPGDGDATLRMCATQADSRGCLEVAERLAYGLVLRGQEGDSLAAVQWALKALEGREELLGDLDEDTLASRSTLATALESAGKREEALHWAQLALSGRSLRYGTTHRATRLSASKLGQLLLTMERPLEAEPHLLHAAPLPLPGPQRLLAALWRKSERKAEAMVALRRARELAIESYGHQHPTVVEISLETAELAIELQRTKEAKKILRKVVQTLRQGTGMAWLCRALELLATLLPAKQAAKLLQEAAQVAPDGSEQKLGALRQWAAAMQSLGRLEEAEGIFRQGLRSAGAASTPAAAALANNLASQLRSTGRGVLRTSEVEPLLRWAIKGFEGQQEAKTRAQGNLADWLRSLGRLSEALPLSSLAIGTRNAEDAITAKSNHGILLHALGRQAEAEAFYREALQEAEAVHGSGSHQAQGVRADLAELLKRLRRPQEAATVGRRHEL